LKKNWSENSEEQTTFTAKSIVRKAKGNVEMWKMWKCENGRPFIARPLSSNRERIPPDRTVPQLQTPNSKLQTPNSKLEYEEEILNRNSNCYIDSCIVTHERTGKIPGNLGIIKKISDPRMVS